MDVMDNFLVEVEDLEGDKNTGALSMFMYKGSIPQVSTTTVTIVL